MCIAQFMGTLKSKSALMIFDRHANLKYKYRAGISGAGDPLWIVGKDAKRLQEYIQNQLEEDLASGQMSRKGYMDPFTDSRRK